MLALESVILIGPFYRILMSAVPTCWVVSIEGAEEILHRSTDERRSLRFPTEKYPEKYVFNATGTGCSGCNSKLKTSIVRIVTPHVADLQSADPGFKPCLISIPSA